MCLIAFAIHAHPRYPLIVAANRDEFYHRPTAPLAFWPDHPEILAGRDLEQSGTWLGVTPTGRMAAITNFREPAAMDKRAPSRGLLVSDLLISDRSPADYLRAVRDSWSMDTYGLRTRTSWSSDHLEECNAAYHTAD